MTGRALLFAAASLSIIAAQAVTDGRTADDAGGGTETRPATMSAPLHRTVFREKKSGRYEISIAYPQFRPPTNAAQRAFNRAAHDIVFDKDPVAEYRQLEPPMAKGAENFYEVDYQTPLLDRRLASVLFQIAEYSGGAHPNSARTGLLFDIEDGRALALSDVLADPQAAIPAIAAECKAQIEAEAKKEDWELFDNADFGAVVGDVAAWSAEKDGVDILYNPYSVAAYVVGPRDCRLSYAELARWLKPGGPLPPHQEEAK